MGGEADVIATTYQALPDLDAAAYELLRADIAARGVLVAVEVDEAGAILDGHHRVRACRELGIADWPVVVRSGWTEAAKREHAILLNLARRQLTREDRRAAELALRKLGWSLRRIATVVGVSAEAVRVDLAGVKILTPGAIPERVTGADGKAYPARHAPREAPPVEAVATPEGRVGHPTDYHPPVPVPGAKRLAQVAARQAGIAVAVAARPVQALPADGTIVRADALDFIRGLPDGCVDVTMTSPPYWAKRAYDADAPDARELGREARPDDYVARLAEVGAELVRVTAPSGWLVLNVGDTYGTIPGAYRTTGGSAVSAKLRLGAAGSLVEREPDVPAKCLSLIPWRVADALIAAGWLLRSVLVWAKLGHAPENVSDRLTSAWEPVLWFARSPRSWFEIPEGEGRGDLWHVHPGRQGAAGDHLAPFPDDLVAKVLGRTCPPGGLVLDPYAGSGTVRDVCRERGLRSVGCDLYFGEDAA